MKALFLILALLAVFGTFSGSAEPVIKPLRGTAIEPYLLALHHGNSIVFNLSVGYLVSLFFWFLVVHLPERNRHRILRNNLSRRYQDFRESTIQILLSASIGPHDSRLSRELCDHRKFEEFFDRENKKRWHAALNGLQGNKDFIDEILLELELFAAEVLYVLNSVNIQDPTVHLFFKRLSENIYRLKNSTIYSGDQVKYLGNFLFGIHARWSVIAGKVEKDVIQEMIDEL
ncbi:hypothetical protein [Thauera humireducens]|uniref:hypothetical protein n=1 Tax=Thauera humireducens TaxID=1134435 RepID=UPI00311DA3DE